MYNPRYSGYQFALFRIVFGLYLLIHFIYLLPYSGELWSQNGILPIASMNLTYGKFPNILYWLDTSIVLFGFIFILILCSLSYILGYQRRIFSMILWYGWACLFHRNNLIANPGIPFVGWLLLASIVIPSGENWSFKSLKNEDWTLPRPLIIGAWLIMSISYTLSGIDKMSSASWIDGSAMHHLLSNPLARDIFYRNWFLALPDLALKCMTWGVLAIEVLFLPLSIFTKTRKWIWLLMVAMHIGILCIVDFADLTFGMLMIHFFTLDSSWFKSEKSKDTSIVFFDGVCGMCNYFVNFLIEEDKDNVLKFSPLQGQKAMDILPKEFTQKLDTLVFYQDNKIYTESKAVLKILYSMGGIWKLFYVFKIIPRFIRNGIYKYISQHRIEWFGSSDSCRIPTSDERAKFLP